MYEMKVQVADFKSVTSFLLFGEQRTIAHLNQLAYFIACTANLY